MNNPEGYIISLRNLLSVNKLLKKEEPRQRMRIRYPERIAGKVLSGKRFKSVSEERLQTMEQIENICRKLPSYKLLLTIPGFGPYIHSAREPVYRR